MARLPAAIDTGTPVGQRASTATLTPTDFGLGGASRSLAEYGEARRKADERQAAEVLREAQSGYAPQFAERAAAYDGSEPGWAAQETAAFDSHFTPLLEREDLPGGVRDALRGQLDAYKIQVGGQAIGVESERRAGVVAERRRVMEETQANLRLSEFDQAFSADLQAAEDNFDGSQADYAAGLMSAYDARAKEVLEGTPEALRPAVERALSARRVNQFAQALVTEDAGQDAYVAGQAKAGAAVLANSILSNPAGYGAALESVERLGAGLPPRLRNAFAAEVRGDLAKARVQGLINRGEFTRAAEELAAGDYDGVLAPEAKDSLVDAARQEAASQARALIEAMSWGAGADAGELEAAARASGDPGLQAQATYALAVGAAEGDALGLISRGAPEAGEAAAIDFVIDIEGGDAIVENDNGKGVTRYGINQTANPDLDVRNLTRAQAVARHRRYMREVGADKMPAALGLVAYDAAINHGPAKARELIAEADGDPGRLLALREAEYRRLAAAEPRHAAQLSGWMNRLQKVGARAAQLQALDVTQEGLSSDPIKFAMGTDTRAPLAQVAGLPQDVNDPAFGRALAQRLRLGQTMNRDYRAPQRMLTNAESAYYRDMIERDPMSAVTLASAALASVGGRGARDLMAELGQAREATAQLHLADLAAAGLTNFAETAARGLALKAQGEALDTALAAEIAAELEARKGLFAGQPELLGVVRATAEAAALAHTRTNAAQTPDYYVQSALGGSTRNGTVFGGVGVVNGAAVILPPWLARDRAEDVMDYLAEGFEAGGRGPVYRNGQPIPARELEKMRLRLMPNGNYRLIDRQGTALLGRGGGAFEMDLDAAAPGLRRRFGAGAVQGGW